MMLLLDQVDNFRASAQTFISADCRQGYREGAGVLRTLIDDSKNICRQTTACHLSPRPRPARPARSSGASSARPRISHRRQNLSPTHRCRARNELVWKCLQKALVGAYCYSAIVKSSRTFVASSNTGGGAAARGAETAASHWKQEAKKPHRLSGSTLKWFVSVFCHAWCFIVTFSNDQIAGWTDKNWNYSSSSVDIFHRVESMIDWFNYAWGIST